MDAKYPFLFPEKRSGLFSPLPSKNSRHAPDDAPEACCALFERPRLTDQVEQFVEHHEHAVVCFGRGDLEEAAVGRERQEPPFFAGHGTPVLQVSFVPHDDERSGAGEFLLRLADVLDLLSHHVEAGPVTDAVDQDEAIGPLQLPVADVAHVFGVLQKETRGFKKLDAVPLRSVTTHCFAIADSASRPNPDS